MATGLSRRRSSTFPVHNPEQKPLVYRERWSSLKNFRCTVRYIFPRSMRPVRDGDTRFGTVRPTYSPNDLYKWLHDTLTSVNPSIVRPFDREVCG